MTLRYKKAVLGVCALALLTVGYALVVSERVSAQVAFLDVGQGDATLVSLPGGVQVLIDGGPTEDITASLARHMPFYDRTIELVVLTHPHSDHLRGLNEVLETYRVEHVLATGVWYKSRTYQQFFTAALREKTPRVHLASAGDAVEVGGVAIGRVLSPPEPLLGREVGDVNQTSVVLELTVGGMRFLLTGDVEEGVERELIRGGAVRDVDVLKVGHQGSRNATSREFLAASRPEVAVISVGKNSYGHPHPEALERIREAGVTVLRTDEQGDIVWTFR